MYRLQKVLLACILTLSLLPSFAQAELRSGQFLTVTPDALRYISKLRVGTDLHRATTSLSNPTYILKDTLRARDLMNLDIKYVTVRHQELRSQPNGNLPFGTKFVQISSHLLTEEGDCFAFISAMSNSTASDVDFRKGVRLTPESSVKAGTVIVSQRDTDSPGHIVILLQQTSSYLWVIDQNGAMEVDTNQAWWKAGGVVEIRKIYYKQRSKTIRDSAPEQDHNDAFNYRIMTKK